MVFQSVNPSVVKAIRQCDFLKEWLRLYLRQHELPIIAAFAPARLDDELPDLMFYKVEYVGGEPRYRVTHEGRRLIEAYGITGLGQHLQDTISPALWVYLEPIYEKCVATALPVYSTFHVTDAEGRRVDYERLLLPFGHGKAVHHIIASIKSICVDGRFINTDLMQPVNHNPQYTLRAVIDVGLSVAPISKGRATVEGDVVEV